VADNNRLSSTGQAPDFATRYARFVVRHRWLVIITLLLSTLAAAIYLPQINLRNDPDSLLPLSNPYIATNLYSERTYGMGNIMVWGVKVKQGDIYQPWFVEMLDALFEDVSHLSFANTENFIGLLHWPAFLENAQHGCYSRW